MPVCPRRVGPGFRERWRRAYRPSRQRRSARGTPKRSGVGRADLTTYADEVAVSHLREGFWPVGRRGAGEPAEHPRCARRRCRRTARGGASPDATPSAETSTKPADRSRYLLSWKSNPLTDASSRAFPPHQIPGLRSRGRPVMIVGCLAAMMLEAIRTVCEGTLRGNWREGVRVSDGVRFGIRSRARVIIRFSGTGIRASRRSCGGASTPPVLERNSVAARGATR